MVVVDEASRYAIEVADKSRIYHIIKISTTVLDTSLIGGAKAVPGAGKGKPHRTTGTLARRARERASVGRNKLIRTRPDRAEETRIGVKDHTMPKAQGKPKRAQPL